MALARLGSCRDAVKAVPLSCIKLICGSKFVNNAGSSRRADYIAYVIGLVPHVLRYKMSKDILKAPQKVLFRITPHPPISIGNSAVIFE